MVTGHLPKSGVFLHAAEILSPPEPTTGMLMPGTEEHRYLRSFFRSEGIEESSSFVEPANEKRMLLSSGQHGLHHVVAAHIPSVSPGKRVACMPADGDHPSPFVVADHFFADEVERDIVDVVCRSQLNTAEIESHHCRIITRHTLYIGAAAVALPGDAIKRVILVSEHKSLGRDRCQVLQQILCLQGTLWLIFLFLIVSRVFFLHAGSAIYQQKRQPQAHYDYLFLHHVSLFEVR